MLFIIGRVPYRLDPYLRIVYAVYYEYEVRLAFKEVELKHARQ